MYHFSQLQKHTVKDEEGERTGFLDTDGNAVFAADLKYSTAVVIETSNEKMGKYSDDHGKSVNRNLEYETS